MKLLILSDLHLDEITDRDCLDRLGAAIESIGRAADALIIAGDLTECNASKWPDAIRWLGMHYSTARTVLLPGNHDYYGENLTTVDYRLAQLCQRAGCGYGQCRSLMLGTTRILMTTLFLMTTLWTDMRLLGTHSDATVEDALWYARQMMPDYAYGNIVTGDPERQVVPEDTIAVHARQKVDLHRFRSGRVLMLGGPLFEGHG